MGRVILHIGTHKTATTSIQRGLARNRARLAAQGILYPDYDLIGRDGHYAHLGAVNALAGAHPRMTREEARRFFERAAALAADFDAVILSGEPFYRRIAGEGAEADFADRERYWRLRRAYVAEIRDLIGEAEVAVAFRRQADYAQSLHQEHVKATRYVRGFADFLDEFWFHFDYLGQAEVWAEVFPRLRALRFDDLVADGRPLQAFLATLGLKAEGLEPSRRFNPALVPDVVILKRMLNEGDAPRDGLRRDVEALAAQLPTDLAKRLTRRAFFESAERMRSFQDGFAADNAALKRRFLPELDSQAPLFDPETPRDLEFGDRPHPSLLGELLRLSLEALGGESNAKA